MFFIGRLFRRLITLALFAFIGAVVLGLMNGREEDAAVAGAIAGAGLIFLYWILRGLFRSIFRRSKKAQIATILDIGSNPPPGAPWYHHTYVLFDIKGKRRKLWLTPEQAKFFNENYSANDTGRLKWTGKKLLEFEPPSPERPRRQSSSFTKGNRVFISYAHGDDPEGQTADYLEQVFRSEGLETWVDKNELAPGDKLREEIKQKIQKSVFFVPLLTPKYMSSSWCLREFELAAELGLKIVPVKISPGRLVAPPNMLKLFNEKAGDPKYLDLTSRGYLDELRKIVTEMAG